MTTELIEALEACIEAMKNMRQGKFLAATGKAISALAMARPSDRWEWTDMDEHGMPVTSYFTLSADGCSITIEKRPHYCDRGNFIAKIHVQNPHLVYVDAQDAWPRYYFDLVVAKYECEAWVRKRGLEKR